MILDEIGVRNLRIETVEADLRDFEETVFAIGRIEEIPSSRSVLSSRIAGRVISLEAFEGDTVSEGQLLARVESRQPGNPPPTIDLLAPQQGLIVDSHIRLGQPVEPDNELLDISDRTKVWAVAKIPEQDAAEVRIGTRAHIRIPALGESSVDATLFRFSVEADRTSGAVEGIFLLDNPDGRLSPGMRAEFSIVLGQRSDVLAIPREAVQGDPAQRVVFARDFDLPNAFVKLPVVLGEKNNEYVEVVAGLFPGDEVVTRGSYSLSFTGSGGGLSLKEALDAAHGHAHNEDGSEITDDHDHESEHDDESEHDHEDEGVHEETHDHTSSKALWVYSVLVTVLCLWMAQRVFFGKKAREE